MELSFSADRNPFLVGAPAMDDSYRPLPKIYLGFLLVWCASSLSWSINTLRHRHFQMNNLQWMLGSVPVLKVLQLGLSFVFWYSCIDLQICSLWMSFGVYVTGIIFQTASLVSFLHISHGYCIMYERLSIPERRLTAALGCIHYFILVGYKAAVPYFPFFLLVNYSVVFYVIFRHISQNLVVLCEQLNLIEDEDSPAMHDALHTKYTMFKKFRATMQIVVLVEILVYINFDEAPNNYWFRLLVQEWAQFCIFLYIGWTFRMQQVSLHFSVMPAVKSNCKMPVPPIYSIEIDSAIFKGFASQDWHVGVRTSLLSAQYGKPVDPLLVLVQHPAAVYRTLSEVTPGPKLSATTTATMKSFCQWDSDEV